MRRKHDCKLYKRRKHLRAQFRVPWWHSDVRTLVNHVKSTLRYQRRTLIMTSDLYHIGISSKAINSTESANTLYLRPLDYYTKNNKAGQCHGSVFVRLSLWNLRLFHVGSVVDTVSVGHVFLQVLQLSLVSIIMPMLYTHSFNYHQCYISFVRDSTSI
jgi:hypothetical protein